MLRVLGTVSAVHFRAPSGDRYLVMGNCYQFPGYYKDNCVPLVINDSLVIYYMDKTDEEKLSLKTFNIQGSKGVTFHSALTGGFIWKVDNTLFSASSVGGGFHKLDLQEPGTVSLNADRSGVTLRYGSVMTVYDIAFKITRRYVHSGCGDKYRACSKFLLYTTDKELHVYNGTTDVISAVLPLKITYMDCITANSEGKRYVIVALMMGSVFCTLILNESYDVITHNYPLNGHCIVDRIMLNVESVQLYVRPNVCHCIPYASLCSVPVVETYLLPEVV